MSAEYVAPLGSTSLVFNFLFARFLVGTPVTSNDIYVRPMRAGLWATLLRHSPRLGHHRCRPRRRRNRRLWLHQQWTCRRNQCPAPHFALAQRWLAWFLLRYGYLPNAAHVLHVRPR